MSEHRTVNKLIWVNDMYEMAGSPQDVSNGKVIFSHL